MYMYAYLCQVPYHCRPIRLSEAHCRCQVVVGVGMAVSLSDLSLLVSDLQVEPSHTIHVYVKEYIGRIVSKQCDM